MTTLDELLSPKRQKIDDDNVAAILTYDVVHDGQAAIRAALVRQTLQEAAKLAGDAQCQFRVSVGNDPKRDSSGDWIHANGCICDVSAFRKAIHAILAETEEKEKP